MRGQARVAAVHHGPSVRTDGPTGRPGECCASGWCTCMDRALRTARHGAASGVRAYATMRARCSNARGGGLALRCKWTDDRCSFALCQGRAVWSAACSGCHTGQWWASGLFCMAVVQLWCTCVLVLGLHPCVMLRGQRIRCGGCAHTQWWAMLNRMQHDATACNQMQPATPGGTCDGRAVQLRCAWTFLTARRCVTACERVRCSKSSNDSRKPSSSSAGYSRP